MSKKLLYLLGIIGTILLGTYFYWKFCCNPCCEVGACKQKKKVENVSTIIPATTFLPFQVKDVNGNLSLSVEDNFNFKQSGLNYLQPVSTNLDHEIEKLKEYLTSQEGKTLSVTGFYQSDETNNSAFPNLGLARANSIKNYLKDKGISSKLIDTYSQLNDEMVADSLNVFHGPLSFEVLASVDNSEKLKLTANEIKENPVVLYFKTGQANINLTPEQRSKIADISMYLDKVEGAMCLVTGHTDKTGDATHNILLGQNRADFAKQYLITNGISGDKIIATSKGQTEPIADNGTEEGRAKNRRTVITIN
ncbi:OmpA family protein [Tenacibaculum adriaticum]|uniref:OmpA family protein n=1 Tax=Tenacibaculum adriaticum TaxID=413713 RepID=A0A5S5DX31_9FLAO|nr:OmpA family protein [Tenacibaculum adriaticum]TYP99818.1 OmpA family protein [Tenacibaculum adriaticum]